MSDIPELKLIPGIVPLTKLSGVGDPEATKEKYIKNLFSGQSAKRDRYQLTKDSAVTVGVTSASYAETTIKTDNTALLDNGLTAEVMDLTSYPDRAVIRLKNDLGYDVYLTRFQIMANRIQQSNGKAGSLLLDSLKHDADIRRNGENVKVISNDYIFDATQVATIADYWYKRCGQKKHLYSLQVKGSALWYEPGEWYTLSLGEAGTNEYIDATVECVSVSVNHSAGGIGSTELIVRECMESWSKTTLYTARLVTGASPKRRTNQSNMLIVASSSFDGTYDYRCDGTADEVQIQAAIDYLAPLGGGEIKLTAGDYHLTQITWEYYSIALRSNIKITGTGAGTVIYGSPNTFIMPETSDTELTGFVINGSESAYAYHVISCSTSYANMENVLDKIIVTGYVPQVGGTSALVFGLSTGPFTMRNCILGDLIATSGNTSVRGAYNVNMGTNNKLGTYTKYGSGTGYGFLFGSKLQQNSVVSASTAKYYLAYSDAAGSQACADNEYGGFNS